MTWPLHLNCSRRFWWRESSRFILNSYNIVEKLWKTHTFSVPIYCVIHRWMHMISKIGSQVFSVDVVWNRTKSSNNDQERSYDFIWLQSEMPFDLEDINPRLEVVKLRLKTWIFIFMWQKLISRHKMISSSV